MIGRIASRVYDNYYRNVLFAWLYSRNFTFTLSLKVFKCSQFLIVYFISEMEDKLWWCNVLEYKRPLIILENFILKSLIAYFYIRLGCVRVCHKLPMSPKKVAEKLPKFFCFSYLFWVLKIKNSHIASYQNFICQSPMIISEVLSISLD